MNGIARPVTGNLSTVEVYSRPLCQMDVCQTILPTFLESLICHRPTTNFTITWSAQQLIFWATGIYIRKVGSRLTRISNPQVHTCTSFSAWIVATYTCNTLKLPFLAAKWFACWEFVWRRKISLRGPQSTKKHFKDRIQWEIEFRHSASVQYP